LTWDLFPPENSFKENINEVVSLGCGRMRNAGGIMTGFLWKQRKKCNEPML